MARTGQSAAWPVGRSKGDVWGDFITGKACEHRKHQARFLLSLPCSHLLATLHGVLRAGGRASVFTFCIHPRETESGARKGRNADDYARETCRGRRKNKGKSAMAVVLTVAQPGELTVPFHQYTHS